MAIPIKFHPNDLDSEEPVYIFQLGDLCIRLNDMDALDRLIEQCRDIKLKRMNGELTYE